MNALLRVLDATLRDPEVVEILINGHETIFAEKRGVMTRVDAAFPSAEELIDAINDIFAPYGQRIDEANPIASARLSDGTLMHVVGHPIAHPAPSVTLRKVFERPQSLEEIVGYGTLSPAMAAFLRACVEGQINILISGGAGSGKTTIANILAAMIPPEDRVIAIEQNLMMVLTLPHLVRLQARPADLDGRGEVSMTQLVLSAARMRPDRLIINEVSGGEAFHALALTGTGITGSLLTMHAASVRDALARLEVMMTEGNPSVPLLSLREMIAAGLNVVVQMERLRDGSRRMMAISEIVGVTNGVVETRDLFHFTPASAHSSAGDFAATGQTPRFLTRLPLTDASVFG